MSEKKVSVTEYAKTYKCSNGKIGCSRENILKKIYDNKLKHRFEKVGSTYVIYID